MPNTVDRNGKDNHIQMQRIHIGWQYEPDYKMGCKVSLTPLPEVFRSRIWADLAYSALERSARQRAYRRIFECLNTWGWSGFFSKFVVIVGGYFFRVQNWDSTRSHKTWYLYPSTPAAKLGGDLEGGLPLGASMEVCELHTQIWIQWIDGYGCGETYVFKYTRSFYYCYIIVILKLKIFILR